MVLDRPVQDLLQDIAVHQRAKKEVGQAGRPSRLCAAQSSAARYGVAAPRRKAAAGRGPAPAAEAGIKRVLSAQL
jgi:hypothetical protein